MFDSENEKKCKKYKKALENINYYYDDIKKSLDSINESYDNFSKGYEIDESCFKGDIARIYSDGSRELNRRLQTAVKYFNQLFSHLDYSRTKIAEYYEEYKKASENE